jgi:DNA polymerase elongation subunit (family B)
VQGIYTSVAKYGSQILYRGYNQYGKRIQERIKFKPTLYLPDTQDSKWKTIDGYGARPIHFESMIEARDWTKKYDGVEGFKFYGNTNYISQFICSEFPNDIQFKRGLINSCNIDIEVHSTEGFPLPEEAKYPITAICMKSSKSNIYHVFGTGEYDAEKTELDMRGMLIAYHKCSSEEDLLVSFIAHWIKEDFDVITGWNVRLFDIPYIVNRIKNIGHEDAVDRLSPWGRVNFREVSVKGKSLNAYEIVGIEQLDYYDLFQKFGYTYGAQESYKLDHIAHVVLGENKLSYEEYGSLKNLYLENHQKYIDYNIKDVMLVERIDNKLDLINLACMIAYKGGVNFNATFGTTAIWDSIVYRALNKENVVVPETAFNSQVSYAGGYVKTIKPGMYDWVVSFDLASLYPNIIAQWNMSPETLVKSNWFSGSSSVDDYLNMVKIPEDELGRSVSTAANGSTYLNEKQGVFPRIVVDYYAERKAVKKKMLEAKSLYEKSPSIEIERDIAQLENHQMAIKILLNSLYGAIGNRFFRYFDIRIAEGITLTGQLAIRWAEKAMNIAMNKVVGTNNVDYVIAIDTDSLYISFEAMVKKFDPKDPVKFLDKVCAEHFTDALADAYEELAKYMNVFERRMVMEREVIANRGIWQAKKRYILNVHNSEGVQYDKPKLKIMGIEAIKSSTPEFCRNKMRELFPLMMTGTEYDTQAFIQKARSEFKSLSASEISAPRGANDIDKWSDRSMIYKKGTPIHVRGALMHNKCVKDLGLSNDVDIIRNGDKVKFTYLKMPNPIKENVIAFIDYLPSEFKLDRYVDYDKQFEKSFLQPMGAILDAVGWKSEETVSLESFFG